jgi:L-amino acid N-acyltransferase YncA
MKFISCTHEHHASAILGILNEAITSSTALFDYHPRHIESMAPWFKAKAMGHFPVIGAVGQFGELLGFATYGEFRAWPAYKYTVEHSVYVHRNQRGKGIGSALMKQLIAVATEQQYHVMIGGIEAENTASIAMHQRLGFTHCGTICEAGFKFGRWLDLAFYQFVLETPRQPKEG